MEQRPPVDLTMLLGCLLAALFIGEAAGKPQTFVRGVTPRQGSINGGTKITILGDGFAKNQFNFGAGNSHLGNKVELVTDSRSFPCDIHLDGCTRKTIVCYTRPMPLNSYNVRVSVDGEMVPLKYHCNGIKNAYSCKLYVRSHNTPTIDKLTPTSGQPGLLVTMTGRIVTARYESTVASGDNGNRLQIKRVYVGGQKCELKNRTDDSLYGLTASKGKGGYGYIICKVGGSFVGNQNASFLIEGNYGRSLPNKQLLRVSADQKMQMLQTYAEITSLEPSKGSVRGGLLLTINGRNFDNTTAPPRVLVGGTTCHVEVLEDSRILCRVGPAPENLTAPFPGNRGVKVFTWNGKSLNYRILTDLLNMTLSSASTQRTLDELATTHEKGDYASRAQGFFAPPLSGYYRLCIKADDGAILYLSNDSSPINKKIIVECQRCNCPSNIYTNRRKSENIYLEKGENYYLEILHLQLKSPASYVAAFSFHSNFTADDTGLARQEAQEIVLTSVILDDIQLVKLDTISEKEGTSEVQVIEVYTGGQYSAARYQLQYGGSWTALLSVSASSSEVLSALKVLPSFAEFQVNVSTSDNGAGSSHWVTISSELGDIPELVPKVFAAGDPNVTVTVTEKTKGTPTFSKFVFEMDGVFSPLLPPDPSAEQVKEALGVMFSTRCPPDIKHFRSKGYYNGFEDKRAKRASGTVVRDVEPFCGRASLLNPTWFYRSPGYSVQTYRVLCLAIKAAVNFSLKITYSYLNSMRNTRLSSKFHSMKTGSPKQWFYTCLDIPHILKPTNNKYFIKLTKIEMVRSRKTDNIYIDEVFIGRSKPSFDLENISLRRQRPPKASSFFIDSIHVEKLANRTFRIQLSPFDCGHGVSPFSVLPRELAQGGNRSGYVNSSTDARILSPGIWQQQKANPGLNGTFRVSLGGHVSPKIPVHSSPKIIKDILESTDTMGVIHVRSSRTCYRNSYLIRWRTRSGSLPLMKVNDSQVTGLKRSSVVHRRIAGGLWLKPIQGDMLKTVHDKPQVIVYINDIPSAAAGDASFEWLAEVTPNVTGIAPDRGGRGSTVTITGRGFGATPSSNNVTVGSEPCLPVSSSQTQIVCRIGSGTRGTHIVYVNVDKKGLSNYSTGNATFTYTEHVTTIRPLSGSSAGCTLLHVVGYGFSPSFSVLVGGKECKIKSVGDLEIVCVVPSVDYNNSLVNTTVTVEIRANGTKIDDRFSFTYSQAPVQLISVNVTEVSVLGGAVEIFGSNFTNGWNFTVYIGNMTAKILNYDDDKIVVLLPPQPPGSYQLQLADMTIGCLYSANPLAVDYILSVADVSPTMGSLYGGTLLTILGSGFSVPLNEIKVTVGNRKCDIEARNASMIVCMIERTERVYTVTNQGFHPDLGRGYRWEPDHLNITTGDRVRWLWTTPAWLKNVGHLVEETSSPEEDGHLPGGFSSGRKRTSRGSYSHLFTTVGTYYYWSGNIDVDNFAEMRGKVNVVARQSSVEPVTVSVGGAEASISNMSEIPSPSVGSDCDNSTSVIGPCDEPAPSGGSSNKFNFTFWSCSTPVVTSVTPNNGTGMDSITIRGSRLSTTPCENVIEFGSFVCSARTGSEKAVSCSVSDQEMFPAGQLEDLAVRIANRGYGLVAIERADRRRFVLLPHFTNVSPSRGSVYGGTHLTITGGGFPVHPRSISVQLDGYECVVMQVSYARVVCRTPPNTDREVTVTVSISRDQIISAACRAPNNSCTFRYLSSISPEVTGVFPRSLEKNEEILKIMISLSQSNMSNISVTVGNSPCVLVNSTDTFIRCTVANVPAGKHKLTVHVTGVGRSLPVEIDAKPIIYDFFPGQGSIHGGTLLTITGTGFLHGKTRVGINTNECTIKTVTPRKITCLTPANPSGNQTVFVTSNEVEFPRKYFEYSNSATPVIRNVSPKFGYGEDLLTINGSGFSDISNNTVVFVGQGLCQLTSASETFLSCVLGHHQTGRYQVVVHVRDKGNSNNDVSFSYQLNVTSIHPVTGSFAGGQRITIHGRGFDPRLTNVTICNQVCAGNDPSSTIAGQNSMHYTCITPAYTGPFVGEKHCDVVTRTNNLNQTLAGAYTYNASLTAIISSVSPVRGGTAGGTRLTISGRGFSSNSSRNSITVEGESCVIKEGSASQLVCITGPRKGSVLTKVAVSVSDYGLATQDNAGFYYIDVWSSRFTWGNSSPPVVGDFVVVSENQTLLLDVSTPVLSMLLIKGGRLIFDDKDIELQAEKILITDGGSLQVGTEAQPFKSKAFITLHGHVRSKELPIYGTKSLSVREGVLDLHGQHVPHTWTRLAENASAGSSIIKLQVPVTWKLDDQIVIATTGHHQSQKESELRSIRYVSPDHLQLTLDKPLEYDHLGVTETYNGIRVELRAEVALLTRNVVVRGSRDPQWNDTIEACPSGFNTGEFAVQTCFQGRFGEEIGSSQFGGQIMLHAPRPNENLAIGRIEYVEITHAGQAFRLGRYPVHLHLNGDMSKTYVRGCAIHHTFNRAVNVHGSHNTIVERNVLYDVMGGAFFLEDGIETGNTFQYNLGIFVRSSTSLRNDDITPAAFWITNPNNTIRHNAAVGGTHFGYWYRMLTHPEGPSHSQSVCPQNVPLGEFFNNSAHSLGWFGLWTFEKYIPRVGGSCTSRNHEPAKFKRLTAWNCEKGAESVVSGALQFYDFRLVHNQLAGYEGKLLKTSPQYNAKSMMVANSLIVGRSPSLTSKWSCTRSGIVFPYGNGFMVRNVTFVNFDHVGCASMGFTRVTGECSQFCGGYLYMTEGLKFVDSSRMGRFEWQNEGVIHDLDGSLTGHANHSVLPSMDTLPPDRCKRFAGFSTNLLASVCDSSVRFHRFSFNQISSPFRAKNAIFTNRHGSTEVPFMAHRISHPNGWMIVLVDKETYNLEFKNAKHVTNISYTGTFYQFRKGDYVLISQRSRKAPDRFMIDGKSNIEQSPTVLNYENNSNGDWFYNGTEEKLTYLVSYRESEFPEPASSDQKYVFKMFTCYFPNCEAVTGPRPTVGPTKRTSKFYYWSNTSTWKVVAETLSQDPSRSNVTIPQDGDDIIIPKGVWIVADVQFPSLNKLEIYGVLEFDDRDSPNVPKRFVLNATYIYIKGGRLIVGWEDKPFPHEASIVLRGKHKTPIYPNEYGPTLGSKFLAVFGGLDLHGQNSTVQWTRLSVTAAVGSDRIALENSVSWKVGDEIVIASTGYSAWETETFSIEAKSANSKELTLNSTLKYPHTVHKERMDTGEWIHMAAEVGLLTKSIRVIGEDYPGMFSESFGARVIVGSTVDTNNFYSGYARISNTEFFHTGQEGWTEPTDPRFSVAFVRLETPNRCYVRDSSFHHGFSSAIGIFESRGISVENNVIHHTVGSGILTKSDSTVIRGNLVTLSIWPGAYQNRREPENIVWNSGVEAVGVRNLTLEGNAVAGSERMGYHVDGEECDGASFRAWSGNTAHSALIGVGLFPEDDGGEFRGCRKFSGFSVYRCSDFGLYYNARASGLVVNFQSVENGVGVFPMVIGPLAASHAFADKTFTLKNSLLVGTTRGRDCDLAELDLRDDNIRLSGQARPWRTEEEGRIGVSWPNFVSGSNMAPLKPFATSMTYPSIRGLMLLTNVTFAHFGRYCTSRRDVAISTNPRNQDGLHPMKMWSTKLMNVDGESKVYIHRPDVKFANSADCVDMDCDGMKKALLEDMDGSFLGGAAPVSLIPQSEYEWNVNRRRGLGDYRIPKSILVATNGSRLPTEAVAPHKGIIRDPDRCSWQAMWQAYKCHGIDYKMLILESMDVDTETRRLSPVALLGNGYLDLINGPQDHGWCSGYTCRRRLSTFMALVATGKHYEIHFTGTSPQNLRFHLLNSNSSEAITVAVWYSLPNRLDVTYRRRYIPPKNAKTNNGRMTFSSPKYYGEHFPRLPADPTGSNFFDRSTNLLHLLIRGKIPVDVNMKPAIIVVFSVSMSEEEFFGENIVSNLATFLGVPVSKVRIVNVVSESRPSGGRRRRAVGDITSATVEIADPPSSDDSVAADEPLSYENLTRVASSIVNSQQLGQFGTALNLSITDVKIEIAACNMSDPSCQDAVKRSNGSLTIKVPDTLRMNPTPRASYEGGVFPVPPCLQFLDKYGDHVDVVGAPNNPWMVTARLLNGSGNHQNANLGGSVVVPFQDGWANFTDLFITHLGKDYTVSFTVSYPQSASHYALLSPPLFVDQRPITAALIQPLKPVKVNSLLTFVVELQDNVTKTAIADIAWRGHQWTVGVFLVNPNMYKGTLVKGESAKTVERSDGRATFRSMKFTEPGVYLVQFHVMSKPAEYDFRIESELVVLASLAIIPNQDFRVYELWFTIDYDKYIAGKENYFDVMVTNFLADEIKLGFHRVESVKRSTDGELVITSCRVSGSKNDVKTTLDRLCSLAKEGKMLKFFGDTVPMTGFSVSPNQTEICRSNPAVTEKDTVLQPGIIAAIVTGALSVVIAAVTFVVWNFKIRPNKKISSGNSAKISTTSSSNWYSPKKTMEAMPSVETIPPPTTMTALKD